MSQEAINSINWLAKNLKGLIELAPKLSDMEQLESYLKELDNKISIKRAELQELLGKEEKQKSILQEINSQAAKSIDEASKAAVHLKDEAIDSIRKEQEAMRENFTKEIEDHKNKIISLEQQEKDITKAIANQNLALDSITEKYIKTKELLDELKAKL